jgi:tetratricopeptide (TPR) repeat protein
VRILLSIVLSCAAAVAQTDPSSNLESLLAEARRAQTSGDYRAAAGAYRQAVALRPASAELWSNLGLMEYETHEFSRSEEAFRKALNIDRSLFVPNLFLGLALLELKRPREAAGYLMSAEKLQPGDAQALIGLGRCYHAQAEAARSREWYQRAADLAPRNADAWFGLGVSYLDLAEEAKAKLTSDAPEVSELKAHALAAFERVDELQPDSPRIHALLGDVYQRRRMFREAEEEYSKILTLDPNNIAGLSGLAAAFLHDGHYDEAQATAEKALARDSRDAEINLLMAEILVAQHKYTDAEPYVRRSLNARPDLLPRAHALLGRVYARTGREKEAIGELVQGLASDEDGSVHYQLARLYQSAGNAKAAAAAFEKSQQIRAKRELAARENLEPIE